MTDTSRKGQVTGATAQQGVPTPRGPVTPLEGTRPSGWTGWIYFAAAMLVFAGMFQVVLGLVALFDDGLLLARESGLVVDVDYDVWGGAHLVIGAIALLVAAGLVVGNPLARVAGVAFAVVSAVANLAFLPAYPIWSTILIAIDVLIIYAITVHGHELRSRRGGRA